MSAITDTDVLVVGAGSAGAAAARFFAQRGNRVTLVDKRSRGETGARWVNLVPSWCFDEAGIARPRGDETPFGEVAHLFHLVAPGRGGSVAMESVPALHVDMRAFVARLVDDAVAAGVSLERGRVERVDVREGRVRAVTFARADERFTVRARLVVDASGVGGAIRKRVPLLAASCPDASPAEICAAAQFQHEVADPAALVAFLARYRAKPGDSIGFSGVAGGYSTLSLFTTTDLREVGILTGSIPALGVPSALELYEKFVAGAPFLGRQSNGGAGAIPLRRVYRRLGAHGVALVGDAACQVYGSHGSGVGMGLLGARALADAADRANDPGADLVLERYTASFHRAHGGLLLASDAFRRYLQGAAPEELDTLVGSGLLEPELARATLSQRPTRPDARFLAKAPLRALRAFSAARRFLPLAMRTVLLDQVGPIATHAPRLGRLLRSDWSVAAGLREHLLGRAAQTASAGAWSLPDAR